MNNEKSCSFVFKEFRSCFWEVTAFLDNVEVLVLDRFTMLELLNEDAVLRINLLSLVHNQLEKYTNLWVNAE